MSDTETTPAAGTAKPKKSRRLLALVASLVLTSAGAGGAWFWMQRDAHAGTPEKAVAKKPLFSALEPFTVNLQEPRGDRFAQIGVTLEFEDPEIEVRIKDRLPALRNNILMLLSSKRVDDLLSTEGKAQLAREIQLRSAQALGYEAPAAGTPAAKGAAPNPVRGVLFSQFIVQ